MDSNILKKRLSTFRSENGRLRKISDDLLVDILRAWESWAGTSKDFYRGLGLDKHQLAAIIRDGKKLIKRGVVTNGEFKELKLESIVGSQGGMAGPIEVNWEKGKVIRFSQVETLVDFLKKVV